MKTYITKSTIETPSLWEGAPSKFMQKGHLLRPCKIVQNGHLLRPCKIVQKGRFAGTLPLGGRPQQIYGQYINHPSVLFNTDNG